MGRLLRAHSVSLRPSRTASQLGRPVATSEAPVVSGRGPEGGMPLVVLCSRFDCQRVPFDAPADSLPDRTAWAPPKASDEASGFASRGGSSPVPRDTVGSRRATRACSAPGAPSDTTASVRFSALRSPASPPALAAPGHLPRHAPRIASGRPERFPHRPSPPACRRRGLARRETNLASGVTTWWSPAAEAAG